MADRSGGANTTPPARDVPAVPGAGPDTPLVAVSRSGVSGDLPLTADWGPEDLVRA
ncbi:hypothetical protein [Streptomyces sp. GC420]|uniref:hypothetical protein n=1 Tax=Streptomyces sp. GC420 TaxID=2697568 RepID=UPI0037D9C6B1